MNNSFITNLSNWLEEKMMPIGVKISNQRHLAAIRNGLTLLIPLTIIGGFACLLAVPPIPSTVTEATNVFYAFLLGWQSWATANYTYLMIPYYLTLSVLTIYVVLGVAYNLAKSYKLDAMSNAVASLLVFLVVSDSVDLTAGTITISKLGASYMFGGLIIAIATVEIVRLFNKYNIVIKLPDAVPANVAAPFNVLLPLVFNVIFFTLLNILCTYLTGAGLTELVFTIFTPLLSASDTLPSALFLILLSQFFWFFGIHGDNLVGAVTTPIITANLALNLEAYQSGGVASKIYAGYAATVFTGWLVCNVYQVIMAFFCKSERLKGLVKVSVIPSIFNINEPGVFGIPTVLNIYTYLAQTICTIINLSVYWFCASAGLVGKWIMTLPFTTPGIVAAIVGTLDFRTGILWIILFFVDLVICLPFFRIYDNQLLKEEAAAATEE
ncbi:MAG: PTS transporter subunit EIIC [Erysipelotrichaceae bacterium]|nr:PTS transporter subunit EIIC [Erysipelotrichaceae bacterium]